MNRFESWYCGSPLWRYLTRRELLPWMLQGVDLGPRVLELGAGPGAATGELARQTEQLTSLEWSQRFAADLSRRVEAGKVSVVRGDAAVLPFADASFSAVIAILMFHHLHSPDRQDLAFSEAGRVLKPGGLLLAFEIEDGWIHRLSHLRSTFTPVAPTGAPARLKAAGFENVTIQFRSGGFRVRAVRRSRLEPPPR